MSSGFVTTSARMERGSTYPLYQTGSSIVGSIYSGAGAGVGEGVGDGAGVSVGDGVDVGTSVAVGSAAGTVDAAAAACAAGAGRVGAATVSADVRTEHPKRKTNPKMYTGIIRTFQKRLTEYSSDNAIDK